MLSDSSRCRFCLWLKQHFLSALCGDMLWNADMSLELDRLLVENERLRELVEVER